MKTKTLKIKTTLSTQNEINELKQVVKNIDYTLREIRDFDNMINRLEPAMQHVGYGRRVTAADAEYSLKNLKKEYLEKIGALSLAGEIKTEKNIVEHETRVGKPIFSVGDRVLVNTSNVDESFTKKYGHVGTVVFRSIEVNRHDETLTYVDPVYFVCFDKTGGQTPCIASDLKPLKKQRQKKTNNNTEGEK